MSSGEATGLYGIPEPPGIMDEGICKVSSSQSERRTVDEKKREETERTCLPMGGGPPPLVDPSGPPGGIIPPLAVNPTGRIPIDDMPGYMPPGPTMLPEPLQTQHTCLWIASGSSRIEQNKKELTAKNPRRAHHTAER